jgi:sec-independent protein translocase protein TatA
MSLGFSEVLIILAIALLFFGPTRLPGLGKSLGEAIRGFKKGLDHPEENQADVKPEDQLKSGSTTEPIPTAKQKERIDG